MSSSVNDILVCYFMEQCHFFSKMPLFYKSYLKKCLFYIKTYIKLPVLLKTTIFDF